LANAAPQSPDRRRLRPQIGTWEKPAGHFESSASARSRPRRGGNRPARRGGKIEEGLSERCLAAGVDEKTWSHRFSGASCWAQAGNFCQAIAWCDDLLAQTGLPYALRHRVETCVQQLRARRARWYADLATATGAYKNDRSKKSRPQARPPQE